MPADVLRDFWAEPALDAPRRSALANLVIPILMAAGVADGLLSAYAAWPSITIPLMTALPIALCRRHTHPLAVAAVIFGSYSVLHGAMLVTGTTSTFLNAGLIGKRLLNTTSGDAPGWWRRIARK